MCTRRVFSLRLPPPNDTDDAERQYAPIPSALDIEGSYTQLILKPYDVNEVQTWSYFLITFPYVLVIFPSASLSLHSQHPGFHKIETKPKKKVPKDKENARPSTPKTVSSPAKQNRKQTPPPTASRRPGNSSRLEKSTARGRGEHKGRDYFGAWGLHPLQHAQGGNEETADIEALTMGGLTDDYYSDEGDGWEGDAGHGFVGGNMNVVTKEEVRSSL